MRISGRYFEVVGFIRDKIFEINGGNTSFVIDISLVEGCRTTSIIAFAIPNFPAFDVDLFNCA